jgi:molybdopterin converting factor small subunit
MALVRIRVAALLYSYTGGQKTVEVDAATVEDAINAMDRQFPGIAFRIVDEQRQIRPHMNVFVNEENVRDSGTAIETGDEIYIVGALSGG